MTAPNGAILFNSSTGSDTTASGLGSANVYGSGASTTGSSAVVTGIDTTGVSSGDLLWVQSSSGRQFSIIATVDSSTQVTCDDVFANTESGRTWAIGGKRASFDNADSRKAFQDCVSKGWEFETETNQTVNTVVSVGGGAVDNRTIVKGSTGSEVITQTANTYTFGFGDYYASPSLDGSYITFENLQFENTSSSKSSAYCFRVSGDYGRLHRIKLTSQSNNHQGLLLREAGHNNFSFEKCVIQYCISDGINMNRFNLATFDSCYIANNGGYGIYSNRDIPLIRSSVIANNTSDGVYVNACNHVNNIFYANGGSGIRSFYITPVIGCIFYSNSGYGIQYTVGQPQLSLSSNAFGANSLGATSIPNPYETNTITLTSDPFVSASTGDFRINADAGGGALLRASNYALNTDTSIYPFRQYVSDPFGSGGGNVIVIED